MKVTIIYGSTRHGSTWNVVRLFKEEIEKEDETKFAEFFLPKDLPEFCLGCFTCFLKGEDACLHAERVQPIVRSMQSADVIILASPVYALDVSGAMKAFLDHLCYMWISHRPDPGMFGKVGVVFATTAGAGLSHTAKTMKNSLNFWGLKRIYTFKKVVSAMEWEEVSGKNKKSAEARAVRLASKTLRAVRRAQKLPARLFTRFFFFLMRGMMKKNTWNQTDKIHWEKQGWMEGKKPF